MLSPGKLCGIRWSLPQGLSHLKTLCLKTLTNICNIVRDKFHEEFSRHRNTNKLDLQYCNLVQIFVKKHCTMRSLETCLYRFCLLICMCSTSYMIYLQFKYYLDNEDMASISYRIFNNEEQDEYPTFSICFRGWSGEINNQSHGVFLSLIHI